MPSSVQHGQFLNKKGCAEAGEHRRGACIPRRAGPQRDPGLACGQLDLGGLTVEQVSSAFDAQFSAFTHTRYSIPAMLKGHLDSVYPTTMCPMHPSWQLIVMLPKGVMPVSNLMGNASHIISGLLHC
ncbi:hypothetical protein EWM64_g4127 [Hericium alpestre]|uniref:Uncharacterized protein n=1 Tax=Hericium alpestre TaxID=135208 RepID=A0A4Z0A0N5_9AGAM|nr:hypothetical protein EWM64_g4127 [Hericium alpestre]